MAEAVIQEIVHLYHEHGDSNYLGEDVTKSQHSIQCALLAEKEGQPPEVGPQQHKIPSFNTVKSVV